jgi:hypothetical protein
MTVVKTAWPRQKSKWSRQKSPHEKKEPSVDKTKTLASTSQIACTIRSMGPWNPDVGEHGDILTAIL